MIFWITFPNISIFLWISIIPEPSELTWGQTPCEPGRYGVCHTEECHGRTASSLLMRNPARKHGFLS